MKKLSDAEIYKIFKPELTPKKMLELGIFGGSYFGNNIKEFPKNWFTNAKLSKTFDVSINRFKVKAGLSREHWLEKGSAPKNRRTMQSVPSLVSAQP